MIGKLTGVLDSVFENGLILDVGGVGYRVFCSTKTLAKMPPVGGSVKLLVETQVREDSIHLLGFSEALEKEMFLLLNNVQGVGTKVALGILSVLTAKEVQMALMTGDSSAFTRASGVGPKLAGRIVSELKGKTATVGADAFIKAVPDALDEAVSALVHLGYSRSEAGLCVADIVRKNPDAKTQDVILMALKEMGKNAF